MIVTSKRNGAPDSFRDIQFISPRHKNHPYNSKHFKIISGARGAPWVSKFGNPLIRKVLVLTLAYVHPSVRPSVRPSVQTLGEGEGSPKATRPGEAECPFFLVAEVNNMAAGFSYARFSIRY